MKPLGRSRGMQLKTAPIVFAGKGRTALHSFALSYLRYEMASRQKNEFM